MTCSIAIPNSPAFSPSSSLFCNKVGSSPEPFTYFKTSLSQSPSPPSPSPPSPSPPCSPLISRIQKPPGCSLSLNSRLSTPISDEKGSSALKRKRPARLDVPMTCTTIPSPLSLPQKSEFYDEGDDYSVYSKKGRRAAIEDRFSAFVGINGDPKQAIFGVFDGHGGAKAAEFAAENLTKNIVEGVKCDKEDEIMKAVTHGYRITDEEFLKEETRGGSCCVTAWLQNGSLVASNAGDCRAVLSNGGVAEALTSDHRPSVESEKERIEGSGGYVDCINGCWRVLGSLAVSRGIGDMHLKEWVIAEPETRVVKLKREHELLILASDGLWEKVGNQEAVDMCRLSDGITPMVACRNLVDLAVSRGSSDDVTVMLIRLNSFF